MEEILCCHGYLCTILHAESLLDALTRGDVVDDKE